MHNVGNAIGQVLSRAESQARLNRLAAGASRWKPHDRSCAASVIREWAERSPERTAILWQDQVIDYGTLDGRINRLAHAAKSAGLVRGRPAAILMANSPDFYVTVFGLARLGIPSVLVHAQAKPAQRANALNALPIQAIFTDADLLGAVQEIAGAIPDVPIFAPAKSDAASQRDIRPLLERASTDEIPLPEDFRAEEDFIYIFTSGTTGMPKALRYSHARWGNTGGSMIGGLDITSDDIFYCVLPLYHSAALCALSSAAFGAGACVALAPRFSVSNFWPEARRRKATLCWYIGEMCRYLLSAPPGENDGKHCFRAFVGSGLAVDVWVPFQQRFALPHIYEGCGASESTVGFCNLDERVGAVGRIPFPEQSIVKLLRYDVESGLHIRGPDGRRTECAAGEVGELISKVFDVPGSMAGRFEGYVDPRESEKKVIRDVFEPGDAWFTSGDLLRRDEDDYFYFVDRIGDTFRWKGENVSTQEVSAAISPFPNVDMATCYGVHVPGQPGRACMAALQLSAAGTFDPQAFHAWVTERLPSFAAPLFVRLTGSLEVTATLKLRKIDLVRDGYSPARVADPLFVRDDRAQTYVPISKDALIRLGLPESDGSVNPGGN
jgi:fatty-acyl-CoA synthase